MERTSSSYFQAETTPKKRKTLDEKVRNAAWEFHYGAHSKEAMCLLCDVNKIIRTDKGGWECGHIVARDWLQDEADKTSVFYLLPCCAGCNRETGTTCILNLLWDRKKGNAIRRVCETIFRAYSQMHPQHMLFYDNIMWKLIRGLFGSEKHPLGGGILVAYEEPLYHMLQVHQIQLLEQEMVHHAGELKKKATLVEKLLHESNRPFHGGNAKKSLWI